MAPGTVVLGKRKRRVPAEKAAADIDAKTDEAAALEEAQAIFRKHFEAQFAPLEGSDDEEAGRSAAKGRRKVTAGKGAAGDEDDAVGVEDMRSETSDSGEDEDGQDEWDGLSSEDEDDSDSEGGWCWPRLRPRLLKQAFLFLLFHPSVAVVLTRAGHRRRGR